MPQLCTVCSHKQRHKINLSIVRGEMPMRRIASQFNVTERAIRNHRAEHLPELLQQAQAAQKQEEADEVIDTYRKCLEGASQLLDACMEALADPDTPGKLTLDARADDVSVIYDDHADTTEQGKPKRKRDSLQNLLTQAEEKLNISAVRLENKHLLPAELLPKVVAQLRPLAELKAKLEGRLSGTNQSDDSQLITMTQINILAQRYQTVVIEQKR